MPSYTMIALEEEVERLERAYVEREIDDDEFKVKLKALTGFSDDIVVNVHCTLYSDRKHGNGKYVR